MDPKATRFARAYATVAARLAHARAEAAHWAALPNPDGIGGVNLGRFFDAAQRLQRLERAERHVFGALLDATRA